MERTVLGARAQSPASLPSSWPLLVCPAPGQGGIQGHTGHHLPPAQPSFLGVHDALITMVPAPRQLRVETVEMPGTACLGVHSAAVTPLLLEPCVTPFSRLQMVGPLQAGE